MRRRGERGTAIVELALAMPLLLLAVVGTFDVGRAVYMHNALANAAADGARFASVDPQNTSCIQSSAARRATAASLTSTNVSVTPPGTLDLGQPITVSVQATYQPITAMILHVIGLSSFTMRASSTMQIRNVPDARLTCPPPATATPTAPTATHVPATATTAPATSTAVAPTATAPPATSTAPPATSTAAAPTSTAPAATATSAAPTSTAPAATATPAPPTATPAPPTATPAPPTATPCIGPPGQCKKYE